MKIFGWTLFENKPEEDWTEIKPESEPGKNESTGPATTLATDPQQIVGDRVEEIIREGIPALAETFDKETGVDSLVEELAGWMQDTESSYEEKVTTHLEEASEAIRTTDAELRREIDAQTKAVENAGARLRDQLQSIATRRFAKLTECREVLQQAQMSLRRMLIGLTGDAERPLQKGDRVLDGIVTAAAVMLTLALEFFLNFGLVQFATNSETSGAFSIAMAIVAALAAHVAATSHNIVANHRHAQTCFRENFPTGRDPENGQRVAVFPLPTTVTFRSRLGHTIFIFCCVGVLGLRSAIIVAENKSWGDLAGSVAFVLLVGGYYLFKLTRSQGAYPGDRLEEYFTQQEKVGDLTSQVEPLEDPTAEDTFGFRQEAASAIAGYEKDLQGLVSEVEALRTELRKAREHFLKLHAVYEGSREWFLQAYHRGIELLFGLIIGEHEDLAETQAFDLSNSNRAGEVESVFSSTRPEQAYKDADLVGQVREAEILEIKVDRLTDFFNLIRTAWKQVVAEEAKKKAAEHKAEAASRVAEFRSRGPQVRAAWRR